MIIIILMMIIMGNPTDSYDNDNDQLFMYFCIYLLMYLFIFNLIISLFIGFFYITTILI